MTRQRHEFASRAEAEAQPEAPRRRRVARSASDSARSTRYRLPVYLASAATVAWLGAAAYMAVRLGVSAQSLAEIAALASGLAVPLALVWLMALVFQRTDPLLERRVEIADGMDRALAPVEAAEQRLEGLVANIERQINHIETATDQAAQSIQNLEDRFREQLGDLFSATADADAKAVAIKDSLEQQRERVGRLVEDLDGKAAQIGETMKDVSRDLRSLVDEARTESRDAAKLLGDSSRAALKTSESSLETLGKTASQLEAYRERLDQTTKEAQARLESVFGDILGRTKSLSGQLEDFEGQSADLSDSTFALGEALQNQKSLMAASGVQSEQLMTFLAEQSDRMEQVAERVERRIHQAAASALERLDAFESRLAAGAKALEDTAGKGAQNIGHISDVMADHAGLISKVAEEAATTVRAAQDSMDSRTAGLGQLLEDAKKRLEEAEDMIMRQQTALSQAARSATDILGDASARFEIRSRELGEAAGQAAGAIDAQGQTLGRRLEKLQQSSTKAGQELTAIGQMLGSESDKAVGAIRVTTDLLSKAVEQVDGERGKFEAEISGLVERLASGLETLSSQTANVRNEGTETAKLLTGLSGDLTKVAADTRGAIDNTVAELKTTAESKFAAIHLRFGEILDTALADLERATGQATRKATAAAKRLSGEAEKITGRADQFVKTADKLEEKLSRAMKDDFLRASSLLIESLSAGAFDISKVLETEIPDTIWKQYLNGDHSVLTRRTVRLGDKKLQKEIARRFKNDAEFRDNILKFQRDFESLMERVKDVSGASPMSVTLISSELGKLYVLLAQATQKL